LECLVCREMTAWSEFRFCEGVGRGKYPFFTGKVESHFRDRESTGKIGKESQSTVEKSNDIHQSHQN
jgi:hypothetical protein